MGPAVRWRVLSRAADSPGMLTRVRAGMLAGVCCGPRPARRRHWRCWWYRAAWHGRRRTTAGPVVVTPSLERHRRPRLPGAELVVARLRDGRSYGFGRRRVHCAMRGWLRGAGIGRHSASGRPALSGAAPPRFGTGTRQPSSAASAVASTGAVGQRAPVVPDAVPALGGPVAHRRYGRRLLGRLCPCARLLPRRSSRQPAAGRGRGLSGRPQRRQGVGQAGPDRRRRSRRRHGRSRATTAGRVTVAAAVGSPRPARHGHAAVPCPESRGTSATPRVRPPAAVLPRGAPAGGGAAHGAQPVLYRRRRGPARTPRVRRDRPAAWRRRDPGGRRHH